MKKTLLIAILLIQNSAVYAAPNKKDADIWLAEFRIVRDRTSDALFINHFDNRRKLTTEIEDLADRAEKLFDKAPYRACINTVNQVKGYWSSAIWLMSAPASDTNVTLSGAINGAWEAGQTYEECRQRILEIK